MQKKLARWHGYLGQGVLKNYDSLATSLDDTKVSFQYHTLSLEDLKINYWIILLAETKNEVSDADMVCVTEWWRFGMKSLPVCITLVEIWAEMGDRDVCIVLPLTFLLL